MREVLIHNQCENLEICLSGGEKFYLISVRKFVTKRCRKTYIQSKSSVPNPFLFYLSIILKGGVFRNIVFSGENKGKSKHNFVRLLVKLFRLYTKKKMYWEIPSASWDNSAIKCVVNWKLDRFCFLSFFTSILLVNTECFIGFYTFLSAFRFAFRSVIGKIF